MTSWKLLWRSLAHHKKSFVWIVAGAALSTAVFTGALVVGDSVKYSLRNMVNQRLGKTRLVLNSGERTFTKELAENLAADLDVPTAPLLFVRGTASSEGGLRRANRVQVAGVDGRFGDFGGAEDIYSGIPEDEAVINRPLALRLGLEEGGEMVLRVENLDAMPRETPLALDSESSLSLRLRVRHIASDEEFGRFDILSNQVTPPTAFLSIETLGRLLDLEGRANVLLAAGRHGEILDRKAILEAVARTWTLEDAGLSLSLPPGRGVTELRSSRVFIHPSVVDALKELDPAPEVILTYFVNSLSLGRRSTPYSFVSAPGASLLPADMSDDEILINTWLAEDLGARPGEKIGLAYFVPGAKGGLVEKSRVFRVRGVVPLEGAYADRDLLPDFPGLAEIESTRDWRPGIPIDLDLIRDKDERYWEEHRGTPKAFVTLAAAQGMWRNRFGFATALRFPGTDREKVRDSVMSALSPSPLGFEVREVWEEGLRASAQSVDFGQLFLGLSFFIILAGLLLTSLLFVFNLEKRADESGLLMAVGFSRRMVRRLNLREGALLALSGSLLGGAMGLGFNQVVLAALKTVWKGAVGTSALALYVRPMTLGIGCAAGFLTALLTIWLTGRRQFKTPITGLLKGEIHLALPRKRGARISLWIAVLSLASAALIILTTDFERGRGAFGAFFSAGILLLVAGMAFLDTALRHAGKGGKTAGMTLFRIGIRGIARRRLRSLTLVGLLACGLFIVFTVGANRLNALKDAERRDSGTGGFAFYAETAIPIYQDLNGEEGRRRFGLEEFSVEDLSFVPLRVREGEDASCLNLNRVSRPQLLGVAPEDLADRGAFRFIKRTDDVDPEDPWTVLDKRLADGSIPAVADNTVIIWGLGKSVGDTLVYESEEGEPFSIRLVGGLDNSVFQGNIIISEKTFVEKFPSHSGSRMFLVDAAPEIREQAAERMRRLMQDRGLELSVTAERLAEFNRVENTYLSIFLILGSFGLVLGSVGLGIVVRRTVRERAGELALLRAVGFERKAVLKLVLTEHLALLAAGVLLGLAAASAATLPAVMAPGNEIPWTTILLLLAAAVINGTAWTFRAALLETRGNLLTALRGE